MGAEGAFTFRELSSFVRKMCIIGVWRVPSKVVSNPVLESPKPFPSAIDASWRQLRKITPETNPCRLNNLLAQTGTLLAPLGLSECTRPFDLRQFLVNAIRMALKALLPVLCRLCLKYPVRPPDEVVINIKVGMVGFMLGPVIEF